MILLNDPSWKSDLEGDIRQKISAADYDAALSSCDLALDRDGSQEVFWHLKAAAADCLSLHEMCATCARQSAALGRHEWSNFFLLGRALHHLARYDDAAVALQSAHALAPARLDVTILVRRVILVH